MAIIGRNDKNRMTRPALRERDDTEATVALGDGDMIGWNIDAHHLLSVEMRGSEQSSSQLAIR
jgi:hypothetical protein